MKKAAGKIAQCFQEFLSSLHCESYGGRGVDVTVLPPDPRNPGGPGSKNPFAQPWTFYVQIQEDPKDLMRAFFLYQEHFALTSGDEVPDPTFTGADMGFAASFIEKRLKTYDCFQDPPEGKLRENWQFVLPSKQSNRDKAEEALGQNIAYAAEILRRQHRHCCYSVFVFGRKARLARWDRAGAIVTEAFDLVDDPLPLCEFFWLFSQNLSEAQRGYDLTAHPVLSPDDSERFHQAIRKHAETQLSKQKTIEEAVKEHYFEDCVVSMWITTASADTEQQFLVSRPLLTPLTFVGRAYRLYWALECSTNRIVLLKDSWRYPLDHFQREGTIMEVLSDVPNVPSVVCHGDVHWVEVTANDEEYILDVHGEFIDEPWVCGFKEALKQRIFERTHYRVVVDAAGYNLLDLSGTSELLHGSFHAFEAYKSESVEELCDMRTNGMAIFTAYSTHGVSFFIGLTGLIGVEVSSWPVATSLMTTHQQDWQFVSQARLTNHALPPGLLQDMESMIWLLIYCGLLRLQHDQEPAETRRYLEMVFDFYSPQVKDKGLGPLGGTGKLAELRQRTLIRTVHWTNHVFQQWIHTLLDARSPLDDNPCRDEFKALWNPSTIAAIWKNMLYQNTIPDDEMVNNLDQLGTDMVSAIPAAVARTQSQMPTSISTRYQTRSMTALRHMESAKKAVKVEYLRVGVAGKAPAHHSRTHGTSMTTYTHLAAAMQPFVMSGGLAAASSLETAHGPEYTSMTHRYAQPVPDADGGASSRPKHAPAQSRKVQISLGKKSALRKMV
ncbi:hypothetical protein BD309DRAFT_994448 [Dichomitus squalens]|uniref:Fungal-type protein kinase domain-containing protein n=1 Tax=Dichomitus squalens TaxID=114155 RepID=A0A4Q9Q1H8_9APHY|nr:hypothetical protein BD309DRAFT_994448 [Dichomitus squalens]TBU60424.1 hypothetical protein BD310DRAFT_1004641 [Dichomitus squalens]